MIKIARIDGDGIGKEVTEAGVKVLESLDLNFDYIEAEAGRECFDKNGTTIPEETIRIAKSAEATLFGAITSTPGQKSPIITLRQELDTYANLRPIRSFKGIDCLFDDLDFLIVRENTEGLYSGNETLIDEEDESPNKRFVDDENDSANGDSDKTCNSSNKKAIAQRVITKKASERISRLAFEEALKLEKESVTCVHKANVLKKTDGLFKDCFYKVSKDYPDIKTNDYYVDACAMYLLTKPQEFDVIVTSNLFGDILSDASAGLVGGLGLAPSGNIGEEHGIFEPVHGSAPDIAGQNISNPIAMLLSVSMMLEYLNEPYHANKVRMACENVLEKGKVLTPDLGGKSKTMDVADAVIEEIKLI